MNEDDTKKFFVNPYYAIRIAPSLATEHEFMTSKEKWIQVNAKLIDELGKEEWLKELLDVLETGGLDSSGESSV